MLIIVFHLGAPGAAYATVISQGVSGVLCLVYIVKKIPILHLEREDRKPKAHLLKIQLGIGIPMALQYSITAIGTMMVQTSQPPGPDRAARYGGKQDRTGCDTGVCGAWHDNGNVLCTEYRCGKGTADPKRISFRNDHVVCLCGYFRYFDHDRRKIYDVSVCIWRCGKNHGFGRYLFEMCRIFFIPLAVNLYRNGIRGWDTASCR